MSGDVPQSNNPASRDGAASSRSGTVRRRISSANAGRNDGNGGNMSMLRYYTDDSPGLKITPVCLFTLVPVYTLLLKNVTNRVSCLRKSCLTLACSIAFEGFFFSRRLNQHLNQVVVLIMSVCFIAFVTMLHAVAKLYQYRSS